MPTQIVKELKRKIKGRLRTQNRFYNFDENKIIFPIDMICTVVNKHSQPRMGMSTLLDNIVNQTIVYYSETSDPTENAGLRDKIVHEMGVRTH